MAGYKLCRECGTPLFISGELDWGSDGVIHMRRSFRNRMVLFESAIIDSLFEGIEELIGLPIAHIVIESRRREVRKYIESKFPAWMRKALMYINEGLGSKPAVRRPIGLIREGVGKSLTRKVLGIGRVYGYGDVRLGPLWGSGDMHPWRVNVIHKPHSVLFSAAEVLASVEAFEGRDHWIAYQELDRDVYEFSTHPGRHPLELQGFLSRRRYDFKPGDITYERCPGCLLPARVAELEWSLEDGTIHDPRTGRRMALFGPFAMDAVLRDLESELGESIPELAVEAQRRLVRSHMAGDNWRSGAATFREMAAMRGVGNITRFEVDEKHLGVTIQNSCMPMLVIGMARAIYEIAMGREKSSYEWSLAGDGDLSFTVFA